MGFLTGKKALITGLISDRSIAYGIAEAMRSEGAELALTYQNDRFRERIEAMGTMWNTNCVIPCDVSDDTQITHAMNQLSKHWDTLDILVHSIAFAPADQ